MLTSRRLRSIGMELCIEAKAVRSQGVPDLTNETALIERCRRQDLEAFGKLVDAYQNRVFGFVRRMVPNADDAADISQEVFIRAFQSFGRFDGRSSLKSWLFKIAYNLCIDRSRKIARTPGELRIEAVSEEDEPIEIADSRWDPESLAMDQELMQHVEDAIGGLSEKLRSVLLLHDREDMAYEEIAEMLGIPVGTVKSRLFLARNQLQNSLNGYLERQEQRK
jgi:RNA polymerase sigma-70 factor, ECF subfamily